MAALDALARRDYAGEALKRKLRDKGYAPDLVERTIESLRAEKLLDDHRYVESFVAYHAARGQGPVRVRAELRQVGVDGPLVEEALQRYTEWLEQLRKARQKKFGTPIPTHYADKQRQTRFLSYRGYTGAQIRMALGFDTDLDVDMNL